MPSAASRARAPVGIASTSRLALPVDPSLSVGYGMRANEQGFRAIVQNVATLAAVTITSTNPDALELSSSLNTRLTAGLTGKPGAKPAASKRTAAVH